MYILCIVQNCFQEVFSGFSGRKKFMSSGGSRKGDVVWRAPLKSCQQGRTGQNKMFMWLMTSTRISGDHHHWDWAIPWLLFSREVKRETAETGEPQTNPSRMRQFNCARDARDSWMTRRTRQDEAGRVTWQQVGGTGAKWHCPSLSRSRSR